MSDVSMFDEQAWEERYRSQSAVWSGRPNPVLVTEAADLAPGTALDAGCGEGADALWLAQRGWDVTAVDISQTALQRAASAAASTGAADRVTWLHADLTTTPPAGERYDLVTAQYMQLPAALRDALLRGLVGAVAPGGTLLVVGHDVSDLETGVHRPPTRDVYYTAQEVADLLDPERWDVVIAEKRPRPATDPEGRPTTIHDAVLKARRHR
jgi:SAM-dependent methyltransferase